MQYSHMCSLVLNLKLSSNVQAYPAFGSIKSNTVPCVSSPTALIQTSRNKITRFYFGISKRVHREFLFIVLHILMSPILAEVNRTSFLCLPHSHIACYIVVLLLR